MNGVQNRFHTESTKNIWIYAFSLLSFFISAGYGFARDGNPIFLKCTGSFYSISSVGTEVNENWKRDLFLRIQIDKNDNSRSKINGDSIWFDRMAHQNTCDQNYTCEFSMNILDDRTSARRIKHFPLIKADQRHYLEINRISGEIAFRMENANTAGLKDGYGFRGTCIGIDRRF